MIRYYSRSKEDEMHLYRLNEDTGEFCWMDHCWTGEGQWVVRDTPIPDIIEIDEARAMAISKGTLYTAPKFLK